MDTNTRDTSFELRLIPALPCVLASLAAAIIATCLHRITYCVLDDVANPPSAPLPPVIDRKIKCHKRAE